MPNQNLQIFIAILVINVMMGGIRSSASFDVNVPGVYNESETSTYINLFAYLPGPSLERRTKLISKIVDVAGRLFLTPYPLLQEKNAFGSSNPSRSLSNFLATDRKFWQMFKGCSANDTLIGPDLPWVEFVETELYVSAYNKSHS